MTADVRTAPEQAYPRAAGPPARLLVGVSGSIAALGLPNYLNAFRQAGVGRLALVLTSTAERFLRPETLRLISDVVATDGDHGPGHVALARWADRILVLPATAHLLGCAAMGLAPNLLTTVLLAARSPVVFAPAMNSQMWRSQPVQRNVRALRTDGHAVVDPVPAVTYEVASRRLTDGLGLPDAAALLGALSRQEDPPDEAPRPDGPGARLP